jgi:hypothetical protein
LPFHQLLNILAFNPADYKAGNPKLCRYPSY